MSNRRRASNVIGQLTAYTNRSVQRVVLDVTSNLVEDTPVDTGWASSNWVPNVRVPFRARAGAPTNISRTEQQTGIANIAIRYEISQGTVYISNNVPYIIPLNDGSSMQAPSAFVQRAIRRGIDQQRGR